MTTKAFEDYNLTTKLFCGYDKEMMVGTGGTGKSGKNYHYYKNLYKEKCLEIYKAQIPL